MTALIDLGAQVSSVSSGFCKQMTLKVNPLDRLLELEGTGGSAIPYLGYVEVNLQIPGIRGYNKDVLLLVIPNTTYSEKVLAMMGSKIINRAIGMITKGELARAPMTWRQAHFSVVMSGSLQLPHKCTGGWVLQRGHIPLQPLTYCVQWMLSGQCTGACPYHTMGHHHFIWDHQYSWQERCLRALYAGPHACRASIGPPTAHLHCIIPSMYGELHPGSFQVPICLRNLSAHPIIIPAKVVIRKVTPTNQVSPVTLPMGTSEESTCGPWKDWIQQELNLQGLEDWPENVQEQARKLLVRWEHLFSQWPGPGKDILNQTSNWTDWLDALQRVLLANTPHMYDDMKVHLKEMLAIGSILKSHSPWASIVVIVWKKDGSLRFCINLRKLIRSSRMPTCYPTLMRPLTVCRGPNGSPSSTWSLGTGRSRWTRRANHWPHSPWGHWDSTSVIECLSDWPMPLPPFSSWCKPALGTSTSQLVYHLSRWYSHLFKRPSQPAISRGWRPCSRNWNRPHWNLSPLNVSYFLRQITYLGHIISTQGIVTNVKGKIHAFKNGPPPTTVTKVQNFLGFMGYYCQFIPMFTQISQPLHELMSGKNAGKKRVAITWNNMCQQFIWWPEASVPSQCPLWPILILPSLLNCTPMPASLAWGPVLYQTYDDGTDAIITYANRSLTKAETHLPQPTNWSFSCP